MSKTINPEKLYNFNINEFISHALAEDIGDGDHTSLSCIPSSAKGKAQLLVKENGILAGVELALKIFKAVDPSLKVKVLLKDGSEIKISDIVLTVTGKSQSILIAERLVLNCMQRMSGIATKTNMLVKLCKGTKTKVIDTRKTTPTIRGLEKWAVVIGGGANHRIGLYDMILIKDNHIDYAGGIKQSIEAANIYLKAKKKKLRIEIEARNIEEVKQILEVGKVHRIMLDNFNYADIRKAVKMIGGKYETEASGGINEKTIAEYAKCGVDFISVGALTHNIKSLDLSLKAIK
ncbi:MAG: nicotinate-nucleotide diphosphorylase (carboxylating) [Bacteroidetes bacterium]|jgi:nicotinate-nucleotide pyrophosphorylase (carboxylating)|nr:nicotinate-nucleotide diphosphorylase (carboxylating) [Bacteroidota bacterium]